MIADSLGNGTTIELTNELEGSAGTGPLNQEEWQYFVSNKGPAEVSIGASALCAKLVDVP